MDFPDRSRIQITPDDFERACQSGAIAIDLEGESLGRYGSICALQLAVGPEPRVQDLIRQALQHMMQR